MRKGGRGRIYGERANSTTSGEWEDGGEIECQNPNLTKEKSETELPDSAGRRWLNNKRRTSKNSRRAFLR